MERELKRALLSRRDLERLRAALGRPARTLLQTNWYFGSEGGELRTRRTSGSAPRVSVRIREEAGARTLTVKHGRRARGGLFVAEEIEAPISSALWRAVRAGKRRIETLPLAPARRLAALAPGVRFRLQGRAWNRRLAYPLSRLRAAAGGAGGGGRGGARRRPGELALDSTRFPDGIEDFEVEAEVEREADLPAVRRSLLALLARLRVRSAPQARTKHERFLARSGGLASKRQGHGRGPCPSGKSAGRSALTPPA